MRLQLQLDDCIGTKCPIGRFCGTEGRFCCMVEAGEDMLFDLFICHASEDKDDFVRPLAQALQDEHVEVWFDEFTLTLGDSIRRAIDKGLSQSRFGAVVLSPAFFSKNWPQCELNGLIERELSAGA